MVACKLALVIALASLISRNCAGSSDFLDLGILHTIARYAEWHAKEEEIVNLLSYKLEILISKRRLVKSYVHIPNVIKEKASRYNSKAQQTASGFSRCLIKPLRSVLIHFKIRRMTLIVNNINSHDSIDENEILKLSEQKAKDKLDDDITSWSKREEWVGSQDMFFTSMAWIHLQDVYLFSPHNLYRGITIDIKVGVNLTAIHNSEIGMFALLHNRYHMSVEWLELAIASSTLDDTIFRSILSLSTQEHNKVGFDIANGFRAAVYQIGINLYEFPIMVKQRSEDRLPLKQIYFDRHKGPGPDAAVDEQFMNLCMGNSYQSPKQKVDLKCHYDRKRDKYFYISPLKVEQLSSSPPLYQFYDVLANGTIEILKDRFGKHVKTGVSIGNSQNDIKAKCGTSAGIGLDPEMTPKMFYRTSEMVSGLKLLISPLHDQYVEYTYGRQYRIHKDHTYNKPEFSGDIKEYGDRVATMIYYLEVPDLGGYTPFMSIGVHAHPIRGSAILWCNMYRNGSLRNDVDHAACPVIHRNKIIMTHFFRYNSNWQTLKCTLNPLD